MTDSQICGTCARHRYDQTAEDYVCLNNRSEYFGDWTPYNNTCDEWEEKYNERKTTDHLR